MNQSISLEEAIKIVDKVEIWKPDSDSYYGFLSHRFYGLVSLVKENGSYLSVSIGTTSLLNRKYIHIEHHLNSRDPGVLLFAQIARWGRPKMILMKYKEIDDKWDRLYRDENSSRLKVAVDDFKKLLD